MRDRKPPNHKRSTLPKSATALALANHAVMGIALGMVFVLIVTSTPFFGVLAYINGGTDPAMTMAGFVGTVVLMFGVGAALTGFILMMEED